MSEPQNSGDAGSPTGLHPQAKALLDLLAEQDGKPLVEMTPEEARALPAGISQLLGPGPEVMEVRDVSIPGPGGPIPSRVYEPVADPPGMVVWYHGGGWVFGTLDDSDCFCRTLALESGCRVVSVDYRLAPEHPFPAAVEDAYAALVWTADELGAGRPLAVAGDSAGGNLAAVTALRARDESGPELALQVLVYPVVDHDYTRSSYVEHGDSGLLLGKAEVAWFWNHYAPDERDWSRPEASPLRAADHAGVPPAYIVVTEHDPLRDEGLAYAEKLRAAGVPVTLRRYEDQLHVFFTMVNYMDSANEAVRDAGRAIHAALAGAAA